MLRSFFVIAALAAPAHANSPVHRPDIEAEDAMRTYFAGERTGGFTLVGLGVGGLAAGGVLLSLGGNYREGLAYPLFAVGTLHVAAGVFVNVASARRVRRFDGQIRQDVTAWVSRESTRMRGVSTQFLVLKIVECALIAGGTTVAIAYRDDNPKLAGVGTAIALEMAATLAFDIVAARRAHRYRRALGDISVGAMLQPHTTGLAVGFAF